MGYLEEARRRSARRKSLWNLLLIPAVLISLGLLSFGTVFALQGLYGYIHPGELPLLDKDRSTSVRQIVVTLAPLFAWLAPSMLIANALAWLLPWARRALDREAEGFAGTDFASANRGLFRVAAVLTPGFLLVGVLFAAW